jgi:hypothetical protein
VSALVALPLAITGPSGADATGALVSAAAWAIVGAASELATATGAFVSAIGGVVFLVLAHATKAKLETSIRARERTFKPEDCWVGLWEGVMAGS